MEFLAIERFLDSYYYPTFSIFFLLIPGYEPLFCIYYCKMSVKAPYNFLHSASNVLTLTLIMTLVLAMVVATSNQHFCCFLLLFVRKSNQIFEFVD